MQMAALLPFTGVEDLKLDEISVPEIATLETNFWMLSGAMGVLPATPEEEDWGAWSAAQTGEDGKFAAAPVLTIFFTDLRSSVGISFAFGADWCNDLTIQWFRGALQIASADFAPDASTYLCAKEVEYYDRLVITFRGMVQPHRFLKLESVSFGTTRTFSDGTLNSLDIYFGGSLTGTDLEISTMNMTLKTRQAIPFLFQRQQSFQAYHANTLVGVFYLDKAERLSADTWDVSTINAIGVLDESTHLGGVYSGMLAGTLIADILTNHAHVNSASGQSIKNVVAVVGAAAGASSLGNLTVNGRSGKNGGSGGGGGYGGNGGTGAGVSTYPFNDTTYFSGKPHCAGGGGGASISYNEERDDAGKDAYACGDGGNGGTNGGSGENGDQQRYYWSNSDYANGGNGGAFGGGHGGDTDYYTGTRDPVNGTFYGAGGGGAYDYDSSYRKQGYGYQGVIYVRIPLNQKAA